MQSVDSFSKVNPQMQKIEWGDFRVIDNTFKVTIITGNCLEIRVLDSQQKISINNWLIKTKWRVIFSYIEIQFKFNSGLCIVAPSRLCICLLHCGGFSKSLSWSDLRMVNQCKLLKNSPKCGKRMHELVCKCSFI